MAKTRRNGGVVAEDREQQGEEERSRVRKQGSRSRGEVQRSGSRGRGKKAKRAATLRRQSRSDKNEDSPIPVQSGKADQDPCTSAEKNLEVRRQRKKMRGKPISEAAVNAAPVVDANAEAIARIRRQIRYFFNGMSMEQNMIDAYSNEGWKGTNREKVRPVKELQKAKARISKFKVKIREAMQELDTMCLEGSIMDSAFDDDGQLDCDEIFCAKCHLHEAEADNDIILCDGACNRGFHQKCLVPPLATEDIPPGDDGWICPVCDCKSDCISLLNDRLGTNFEVETSWESIFPEVVQTNAGSEAAAEDFPSDESDDDDYDPESKHQNEETPQVDANGEVDGGEKQEQEEGEDVVDEKSSEEEDGGYGEGGSDSEDVSTDLSAEEPLSGGEDHEEVISKNGEKQEEDAAVSGDDDDAGTRGKRRRKEVDYKKLHDEMFGMGVEWEEELQTDDEDYGPMKRPRKEKDSVSKIDGAAADHIHGDKSKRIPLQALQRLRQTFEENQLPSRMLKEELSKELELSYRKIDVWFKNVRRQALKTGLAQPTRPSHWKTKAEAAEAENKLLLLRQLGEAEFKLHDMRKTMEAVQQPQLLKLSPHIKGFENSVIDVKRGKRVIYVPVSAQVLDQKTVSLKR